MPASKRPNLETIRPLVLVLVIAVTFFPSHAHAVEATGTGSVPVSLLFNYGNGTLEWHNNTLVPPTWNFFNVTVADANGNVGAVFFASFGSHFVYSIKGAGCPASNIFCAQAWGFWILNGICWELAPVGVDQVPVSQGATAAWFLTQASAFGEFPPTGVNCVSVSIDIKPGDNPTVVKTGTKGSIPVAILSANGFDATTVNPATVRFGRTGTEASPTSSSLEDVDRDGTLDMVLHFNTLSTGIQPGDTQATLMGRTIDTTPFTGSAPILAF